MSEFVYKETNRLKQRLDNLKKAEDLVSTFPNHPTIRIMIPFSDMEIRVTMRNDYGKVLEFDEKIEKLYKVFNGYTDRQSQPTS